MRQSLNPFVVLVLGTFTLTAGCGGELTGGDDADDRFVEGVNCKGAPYPIVLAHGMAGFERIGPLNYFNGVAADLRSLGNYVIADEVAPYEASEIRAKQLAPFVDRALAETGACKVNIIAHSQGGLDSRSLISALGYGNRVASLTTISTPHRGSPLGDIVAGFLPGFADDVVNAILKGVQGLTSDASGNPDIRRSLAAVSQKYQNSTFNPKTPNDSRVRYYSVAGRSGGRIGAGVCGESRWGNSWRVDVTDPLLSIPEITIAGTGGLFNPIVNDGLVSVDSARWGTFLGCVPADHFDEVGQIADIGTNLVSGFNHKDLYRKIVAELRKDGL